MNALATPLVDDSFNRRFFALWALGIGLHLGAWTLGHLLLPEGILRGAFPAPALVPDQGSPEAILGRILAFNVLVGGGLVVAANLFRVGRFPLGYLPVLFHWANLGLFSGTNSFGVVRDRPTAPDPIGLLTSPGFAELTAFTMLAAATVGLHVYTQESLFRLRTEKVREWRDVHLRACDVVAVGVALALFCCGAALETGSILG